MKNYVFAFITLCFCYSLQAQSNLKPVISITFSHDYGDNSSSAQEVILTGDSLEVFEDRAGNDSCAYAFNDTNTLNINPNFNLLIDSVHTVSISLWYNNFSFLPAKLQMLFEAFLTGTNNAVGIYTYDLTQPLIGRPFKSLWYNIWDGYVPNTKWHHIVGIFESEKMTMYYDGKLIGTDSSQALNTRIVRYRIGKNFKGALDDIQVFDHKLSHEQVLELYYTQPDCSETNALDAFLVTGQLFYDYNGNNLKDGDDYFLSKFPIKLTPLDYVSETYPDGLFSFSIPEKEVVEISIPKPYNSLYSLSAPSPLIDLTSSTLFANSFGLVGVKGLDEVKDASFISLSKFRKKDFKRFENVSIQNTGHSLINGHFEIRIEGKHDFGTESYQNYFDPSPLQVTTVDDTTVLKYNVTDFKIFEELNYKFTYFIRGELGDTIRTYYKLSDLNGFEENWVGKYVVTNEMINNVLSVDKKVITDKFFEKHDYLNYTIDFINLSGSYSKDVDIIIPFPPSLKVNEVELVGSSNQVELIPNVINNTLTCHFENISFSTIYSYGYYIEPERITEGQIKFRIVPERIDPLDTIRLNATIKFDVPPEFVTNEVTTIYYCPQFESKYWLSYDIDDVLCHDDSNGIISVSKSINFKDDILTTFNGLVINPDVTYNDLKPGQFTLIAKDSLWCTEVYELMISQPDSLVTIAQVNGQDVHIDVAGGTSPYNILINGNLNGSDHADLPIGEYDYVVTDASGCVMNGKFEITVLSNHFLEHLSRIKIYPNPARENLKIEYSDIYDNLSIFDFQGNLVLKSLNAQTNQLNIEILSDGAYLVILFNEKGEMLAYSPIIISQN